MISILFLSADPTNAGRLRLGEEVREIREKLQLSRLRDHFDLQDRFSVRPADVSQALLDVNPDIVHFSGHGIDGEAICLEDSSGHAIPVRPKSLAKLLEQFQDRVRCVVMNACYSDTQARAIVTTIDNVIGMTSAISDGAAIAFSVGFYQALAAGRSIEQAHKLGCAQIGLHGFAEELTPVLLTRNNQPCTLVEVDASAVTIAAVPTEYLDIYVQVHSLACRYSISVSADITVGVLKAELIEKLNIPTRMENGQPLCISMGHLGTGLVLPDDSTLRENGMQNGDTLVFVIHDLYAG